MAEKPGSQDFRYLPVIVAGQRYAIPMQMVLAVHRLSENTPSLGASSIPNSLAEESIPVIDLRRLFADSALDPGSHVVVLSTPVGLYAILVDGVRPSRITPAGACRTLPAIIARTGCPFSGVVFSSEELTPIINAAQLAVYLSQVASDLIVEGTYVSET